MQQEEISLREIIETIWNGKVIIASITILAMLIAGIYSFFVLPPTYEATSSVRVNTQEELLLSSFAESMKSDVAMNRIIDKLKLDRDIYSINSIRDSIKIEVITDTNIMKLKVAGSSPPTITSIANLLAFELGARIEISDRSQKIVDINNRLFELEDLISIASKELAESNNQLKENPEKIVTKQALADEPYLQSILEQSTTISNKNLGTLQLESENINPVHTVLKERIAATTINLAILLAEKDNIEANILNNESKISDLEQQMDEVKLKTLKSERLLDGLSAVFISPAIEPVNPVGPRKMLNIAIAVVIGVMFSFMIVFVRHYWQNSSMPRATGNGISA